MTPELQPFVYDIFAQSLKMLREGGDCIHLVTGTAAGCGIHGLSNAQIPQALLPGAYLLAIGFGGNYLSRNLWKKS